MLIFSALFISCDFFADGDNDSDNGSSISSIRLSSANVTLQAGGISYIAYAVSPSGIYIKPEWSYDKSIIELDPQPNGAVIKGLKEGETSLTVSYQKCSATAIVKVSGFSDTYVDTTEPYIYSSIQVVNLEPGDSETVSVSLYNGSAADIDGYTWTIDSPATATLQPTGQYCKIQAKNTGYARIKVTNSKSSEPYYIGVYVLDDLTKATYITTKQNLSTLRVKDGDKTITVSLENPKNDDSKNSFSWEVTEGAESVSITPNRNECIVTPLKTGVATIRIKHPDAVYPLEIRVRVIEIVENVFIEPDETKINLSGTGENSKTLTMKLNGMEEGKYSADEFKYEVVQEGEIIRYSAFSNQILVTGVHNGAAQIYVSHPVCQKKRQILVICENQIADAVDASITINTTQDFIKTKVGAEETELRITLEGGVSGDENRFAWSVRQNPKDGSSNVIELSTTNGTVESSRMAGASYIFASCYIKPLAEGTATITITHPRSYYPREILVKVLDKDAVLEQQYYFSGPGILKFLNSETEHYSASLVGAKESEKSEIKWSTESATLHFNANGEEAEISSTGTGNCVGNINISHPKAASPKDVLVLTADTQEDLKSMKAFYSDKTYYSVNAGKTVGVFVNSVGFDTYNEETDETDIFNFSSVASQVVWSSSDYNICSVEKANATNPLYCVVTGIKAGTAKITVSYLDTKATFNVTVYPENVAIGEIEKSVYLSAYNNVVILSKAGEIKEFSVSPVGLSESKYKDIEWNVADESIATIVPNGEKVTITAQKEGETTITVSHKESENTLKINVRIGSEYVIEGVEPVIHIATNTDVITMLKDSGNYSLSASLVNAKNDDNLAGFSFEIDDAGVAEITAQYATGKAYIKPVAAGQAEITVTHEKAKYPKKVLVVIGNTPEELSGFTFLSTTENVVNIGEGNTRNVSVTMENSSEIHLDGYTWKSENPEIASVVSTTAGTAVIKGNKIGVTRLLVSHSACSISTPLEIIIQVIDPIAAAACPWITATPPIINLIENSGWSTLNAVLEGGSEEDAKDFVWISSDPGVLNLYGQNGTAKVQARKAGTAIIKVSHPKAIYPAQIRAICESAASTEYSISVSSGNILSIKPDAGDTSITATLVNGGTTDKYNFNWSLDVYDVVDLTYSANTAIITPLKEGSVTLTVSHPKSAFDQQIKIKIQQYDTFGFSGDSKKITEGSSSFISMQIPASNVETYVSYRSANEKICKISGTKAVCELTGTGNGTTTVYADLVAKKTDSVLSTAEMLVYVEKAAETLTYITGDGGISSTFSMTKGTNKILSAELVGQDVKITDQPNLVWVSSNPGIVKINGTDTTGKATGASVYVEAVESGECTITVSHPKSNTDMVYRIIVPGVEDATVSLNKSFVTLEKGKTTEIKATIEGGTNKDYKSLVWSINKVNGSEIASVMGSGQTVTLYALQSGTCNLRCALANGEYAECTVKVEASKTLSFDRQVLSVEPAHTKTFVYKVSPADATLEWVYSGAIDGTDYINIVYDPEAREIDGEIGKGTVTIEGIKEGNVNLNAVSSYGNKAQIQVRCEWNYEFSIESAVLMNMNEKSEYHLEYSVSPADAEFEFSGAALASIETYTENSKRKIKNVSTGNGKGYFVLRPNTEITAQELYVKARNPNLNTGSSKSDFIGDKTISINCYYKNLSLNLSLESDGKFSSVKKAQNSANSIIYMGDGETAKLLFSFGEGKTSAKITSAEFKWEGSSAAKYGENQTAANMVNAIRFDASSGKYVATLQKICSDKVEELYKITELYEPCNNGNVIIGWRTENSGNFAWIQDSFSVSDGRDESYQLAYLPHGNGEVDRDFRFENKRFPAVVLFYLEDHERNSASQCIFDCPQNSNLKNNYRNSAINTYDGWSKKFVNCKNNPIYMTKKQFEENAWLFCPGTINHKDTEYTYWNTETQSVYGKYKDGKLDATSHGSNGGVHVCPHVITENVVAKKIPAFSTDAQNVGTVGILEVYYSHLGSESKVQIPVMLEIRECEKNLITTK